MRWLKIWKVWHRKIGHGTWRATYLSWLGNWDTFRNDMYEYGELNVTSEYKDLEQLKNMKPINWIQESNVLLQSFFENSTDIKLKCEVNSEN